MRGLTYGPPNLNWLITADLHLTDRPRDAYRFGLFKWLAKQQQEHSVTATFILGDLTDRKDNHSAALVNRIVEELLQLKPPIYILQGNHDAFDRNSPFFRFLNCVDGIEFITEPKLFPDLELAMIPHFPTQASFDEACKIIPPNWAVFMHACLDGAKAENGGRLSGLNAKYVKDLIPRFWLCGDIHHPQALEYGAVYVGAPYKIRFNDEFVARVLLLHDRVGRGPHGQNLYFPCLSRVTLTIRHPADILASHIDVLEGDQVKVKVLLEPAQLVDWSVIRAQVMINCAKRKLEVFGVEMELANAPRKTGTPAIVYSTKDVFKEFCRHEGVAPNLEEAGLELLK